MKDKIIKILEAETFNTSDEAGNTYNVVEDCDFGDIAERIIKLLPNQSEPIQEYKSAEKFVSKCCSAKTHRSKAKFVGDWTKDFCTKCGKQCEVVASQFRQEQTISEERIKEMSENDALIYAKKLDGFTGREQVISATGFIRGFKAGMGYSKPVEQHPQVGYTKEDMINFCRWFVIREDAYGVEETISQSLEEWVKKNSLHPAPNNNFKGFAEFLWQFLLQCDISDVTSYDIQVNKAIESYVHPAPVETDWTVKQEKDIVQASKEFALSNDINWNTEIELMIVNAIREVQSNPVEPKDEYKQPIIAMTPKGLVDTNGKPCTCPRCMGGIDYYPKDEVEPKDDVAVEKECIEFANWLKKNYKYDCDTICWYSDAEIGFFSTKTLYDLFLKQKQK